VQTGEMLRTARRRAGLTQRALAERTGIPQPSIARIEAGETRPRIDTLERLLGATGHALEVEARLGEGVDRSHIRALLALTPDQRGQAAVTAAKNVSAFLNQAQVRGRPRTD
jgi:transcriptional regulator with XRE-family HTH domain